MSAATVAGFLDTVHSLLLLDDAQESQVDTLRHQCADLDSLSQELVQRGWLTAFQAEEIARGHGNDLVLDQYVLVELLGQGGMGAVYKARQRRMKRHVAVKLIRREALHTPGAVQRFQREAEAAAKLSHPNIVTVFDTNEVNGIHFLVMEYIDGCDLARLIRERGPLPIRFACDCIRQAALGLQRAHEQGLIHRDIKPHNLMLTKQGIVKVMDMGLARAVQVATGPATSGITATGAVMGTPDYLAPEQALNAKGVDIRADVYSLGCTLYHLLAGRTPFGGDSVTEKLLKHQMEEPQPVEVCRPGLPKNLPAMVRKMMAKKARHRYQTPAEVALAMEAVGRTVSESATWPLVGLPTAHPSGALLPTPPDAAATWDTTTVPPRDLVATRFTPDRPRPRRRRFVLLGSASAVVLAAAVGIPLLLCSSQPRGPNDRAFATPADGPPPPATLGHDPTPRESTARLN